jgi:hypothetical protein
MIKLTGTPVLARGTTKLVYAHPFQGGCLIKVIRPDLIDPRDHNRVPGTRKRLWRTVPRHRRYADFAFEVDEYLALRARSDESIPCIQSVMGFAETDLGLGLVVEKLCDPDGGLAPTVLSLVMTRGFTDELMVLWQAYVQAMHRFKIVSQDWHLGNLVCAADENQGRRIVLVDGLGDRSVMRLRSRWPWLNRVALRRKGRRALRWMKNPTESWVRNKALPRGSTGRSPAQEAH